MSDIAAEAVPEEARSRAAAAFVERFESAFLRSLRTGSDAGAAIEMDLGAARRAAAREVLQTDDYVTLLPVGYGKKLTEKGRVVALKILGMRTHEDPLVHCEWAATPVGVVETCLACHWRGRRARECGYPFVKALLRL